MIEAIVAVVGTISTGVSGWALKTVVNLSSRVAVLERAQDDQLTLIESKIDNLDKRLERIEKALNGNLYTH